MFAIIKTENGKRPSNKYDLCYLDKVCLAAYSFGPPESMWLALEYEEAKSMLARIMTKNPTECEIIRV